MSKRNMKIFIFCHGGNRRKKTYPMFSIIICDILTLPVSTVASESTFSVVGRVSTDVLALCNVYLQMHQFDDKSLST